MARDVRCFTRNGHDWADRFPTIVAAAHLIKASSFLIDGEAVVISDDGTSDFHTLRSRGSEAVLIAFDLIEHDGSDLRELPLTGAQTAAHQADRQVKRAARDPVRSAFEG